MGNPHHGGLEHLRVDVSQLVSPVFEGGQFITDMSDALFDHALVVKNLVEAAEGMVIKLSTGITVVFR